MPHKRYSPILLFKCKKYWYSLRVLKRLNLADIVRPGITEQTSFRKKMLNRPQSEIGKWNGRELSISNVC